MGLFKLLERLLNDHNIMVDFLVRHQLSTWIPKSEVMLNKYVMFLDEIAKWLDEGSQYILST